MKFCECAGFDRALHFLHELSNRPQHLTHIAEKLEQIVFYILLRKQLRPRALGAELHACIEDWSNPCASFVLKASDGLNRTC